ncbi:MAG: thiamine-phosphate kinase [Acidimicrobiales bacterium]|jgi:thiamine-monophosphate kinase
MVGIGIEAFGMRDDAALLELHGGGPLVASVDSVVEGVHVDLSLCSPGDVGWKALMGALSDLAAMGAAPVGALVALCVPGGTGEGDVALGVMAGVSEAAAATGCPVVGGDVSESGTLMVSVTVLGTVESIGPPAVPRSGGQPDDVVLVTGPCGGSAAGLRALRAGTGPGTEYTRPVARLREGALARRSGVRAMIDVSDGLALDLHRLADASGVGFRLESVPVAEGATLEDALGGGEDYELVLVGDDEVSDHLCDEFVAAGLRRPFRLGSLVADPTVRLLSGVELARLGWQHRVG